MRDSKNLLEIIQKAAVGAVEAGEPTDFCYGTVVSASPLKISVEQKLELDQDDLLLTSSVVDVEREVTIAGEKQKITCHNGLKTGEVVLLLKKKGGQDYLVLDRMVKA